MVKEIVSEDRAEVQPAIYESVDHGPVTLGDIDSAYYVVADLVYGMKHMVEGLLKETTDEVRRGTLQLMHCGLDRIDDEVFRIAPDRRCLKVGAA